MSAPKVHAAFGLGTFCAHTPRANRVRYSDLSDQPNACKRCLQEVAKYQRRFEGMTTCRAEMQSKPAWRDHMYRSTQEEASKALCDALSLGWKYKRKHPPTSARMNALFDIGAAIYAERFGAEWSLF